MVRQPYLGDRQSKHMDPSREGGHTFPHRLPEILSPFRKLVARSLSISIGGRYDLKMIASDVHCAIIITRDVQS